MDKHIKQIEAVQRRPAWFVKSCWEWAPRTVTNLLSDLDWPPLWDQRKIACLTLFHKATHGEAVFYSPKVNRHSWTWATCLSYFSVFAQAVSLYYLWSMAVIVTNVVWTIGLILEAFSGVYWTTPLCPPSSSLWTSYTKKGEGLHLQPVNLFIPVNSPGFIGSLQVFHQISRSPG